MAYAGSGTAAFSLFGGSPAGTAEHQGQAGMILIISENKRRIADVEDG